MLRGRAAHDAPAAASASAATAASSRRHSRLHPSWRRARRAASLF